MDAIGELLLKEIEREANSLDMFGKVSFDYFSLHFTNQHTAYHTFRPAIQYQAKFTNQIEVAVKLEMTNPFTYIKERFCSINLVATSDILVKETYRSAEPTLAEKEEIDRVGHKVCNYVTAVLLKFLKSNYPGIRDGSNLSSLTEFEQLDKVLRHPPISDMDTGRVA